jgi:hypothetical protein
MPESARSVARIESAFQIHARMGIWVKWRTDRLGSRGVTKNIFGPDFPLKSLGFLEKQK